jgi:hypothetical protein
VHLRGKERRGVWIGHAVVGQHSQDVTASPSTPAGQQVNRVRSRGLVPRQTQSISRRQLVLPTSYRVFPN